MSGNQDLIVFCSASRPCAVDVCRDREFCERKNNPLNYAMDAGRVAVDDNDQAVIARLAAREGNESGFRKAMWLKHAVDNLGLPKTEVDGIANRAEDLYLKTPSGKLEILKAQMKRMGIPDPLAAPPPPEETTTF